MLPACCDRFRRYLRPRIEQYLRTDVGQPYRDIAVPTPAGDTLSLRQAVEDPANKCVLVDFWASWCGPCISGMNRIKQLYETYRAAGLEVIGVSLDSRKRGSAPSRRKACRGATSAISTAGRPASTATASRASPPSC